MREIIRNKFKLAKHLNNLASRYEYLDSGANNFWLELIKSCGYNFAKKRSIFLTVILLKRIILKINSAKKTGYYIEPSDSRNIRKQFERLEETRKRIIDDSKLIGLDKASKESVIIYSFLHSLGYQKEAKKILIDARLFPDYVNLRHFYYVILLRNIIKEKFLGTKKLSVLEVGAAGGRFKEILKAALPEYVIKYTIIDLPEILSIGIQSQINFHPLSVIAIDEEDANAEVSFFSSDRYEQFKISDFNLIINTHSFQEMSFEQIEAYFNFIYKNCCNESIFFNTNWLQNKMYRANGDFFVNDPFLYPYKQENKLIVDESDAFFDYAKSQFNFKPDLHTRTVVQYIIKSISAS